MDPDETLKLIREAAKVGDLDAVALWFGDLDEWLSSGGFLPEAWEASYDNR